MRMSKIDPAAVYVCMMGYAVASYTIPAGTRLRGSHEAVRLAPANWALDGTLPSEWHNPSEDIDWTQGLPDRAEAKVPRISPSTPISQLMVCVREVIASRAGACPEGRIELADSAIVAAAPEAFVSLLSQLGGEVTVPMLQQGEALRDVHPTKEPQWTVLP